MQSPCWLSWIVSILQGILKSMLISITIFEELIELNQVMYFDWFVLSIFRWTTPFPIKQEWIILPLGLKEQHFCAINSLVSVFGNVFLVTNKYFCPSIKIVFNIVNVPTMFFLLNNAFFQYFLLTIRIVFFASLYTVCLLYDNFQHCHGPQKCQYQQELRSLRWTLSYYLALNLVHQKTYYYIYCMDIFMSLVLDHWIWRVLNRGITKEKIIINKRVILF